MKSPLVLAGFGMMLVAMLFFVAGAPTFNLLPRNYANFGGIAAGAVGTLLWMAYGIKHGQSDDDQPK